jgi:hypothetical protein
VSAIGSSRKSLIAYSACKRLPDLISALYVGYSTDTTLFKLLYSCRIFLV